MDKVSKGKEGSYPSVTHTSTHREDRGSKTKSIGLDVEPNAILDSACRKDSSISQTSNRKSDETMIPKGVDRLDRMQDDKSRHLSLHANKSELVEPRLDKSSRQKFSSGERRPAVTVFPELVSLIDPAYRAKMKELRRRNQKIESEKAARQDTVMASANSTQARENNSYASSELTTVLPEYSERLPPPDPTASVIAPAWTESQSLDSMLLRDDDRT